MILLNTHTWIWSNSATKLLSDNVKMLIKQTETDQRAIASISIWEFAMMVAKGRIKVKIDPKRWLNNAIGNSRLQVIEFTPEIAMESCNLPGHEDPGGFGERGGSDHRGHERWTNPLLIKTELPIALFKQWAEILLTILIRWVKFSQSCSESNTGSHAPAWEPNI